MEQAIQIRKHTCKALEMGISVVGYALILTTLSVVFKNTIQIDNGCFGIWGLLVSFVIYILNKTVKPLLFSLTLPITAMTLFLSYPFINVIILNIVDLLFGNYFTINGILMGFIVASLISILNVILGEFLIKPIIKGERK